jgi:hypothetical protein
MARGSCNDICQRRGKREQRRSSRWRVEGWSLSWRPRDRSMRSLAVGKPGLSHRSRNWGFRRADDHPRGERRCGQGLDRWTEEPRAARLLKGASDVKRAVRRAQPVASSIRQGAGTRANEDPSTGNEGSAQRHALRHALCCTRVQMRRRDDRFMEAGAAPVKEPGLHDEYPEGTCQRDDQKPHRMDHRRRADDRRARFLPPHARSQGRRRSRGGSDQSRGLDQDRRIA